MVLAELPDLFQDRVERVVGISGFMPGRLSARRDRGAHARGTAVLDRGKRSDRSLVQETGRFGGDAKTFEGRRR
jgi:hypothetical protein